MRRGSNGKRIHSRCRRNKLQKDRVLAPAVMMRARKVEARVTRGDRRIEPSRERLAQFPYENRATMRMRMD